MYKLTFYRNMILTAIGVAVFIPVNLIGISSSDSLSCDTTSQNCGIIATAHAQQKKATDASDDPYNLNKSTPDNLRNNFFEVTANIIKALLSVVGIVFLILIIWGGLQWMVAGGNEQKITQAKTILTTATIGLVIVIAAYSITYFVVNSITGAAIDVDTGIDNPTLP